MVDTIGQNISSVSYGWYDWKRETQIKIAFWFWLILNIINYYTRIICCKLHFTSKAADLICFSVVYRMAMQSTSSPSFRPAQLAGRSNTRTVPLKVKPENRCKNFRGLHASFIRTHFIYIYTNTHTSNVVFKIQTNLPVYNIFTVFSLFSGTENMFCRWLAQLSICPTSASRVLDWKSGDR